MARRAWLAVALALCAAAAPSLGAGAPRVDFLAPAQAEGDVAAGAAQWALLLVHGAQPDGLALGLEAGGSVTNHTVLKAQSRDPAFATAHGAGGLPQALPGEVHARLRAAGPGWSSLYVEADSLRLAASSVEGVLGRARAGEAADLHLPPRPAASDAYREAAYAVAADGAWLAVQAGGGDAFPFTLEASGVRRLEWHNATLECASGPCPGPQGAPAPAQAGGLALHVLSYTELQAPGGWMAGSGRAVAAVVGGAAVDAAVQGSLRLPAAAVEGECGDAPCPDPAGRTLRGSGSLLLSGVAPHPSDPQRLRASVQGAFDARFDESPPFPFGPAAAAAAAGLAVLALPLAAKALVGLFARSARPPPLRHPRRQALYDLIRAEPGLSFRAIQRRLAWPNGTLTSHMARLTDAGLVVRRPHRNTVRYFENHGRYDQGWGAVVALRDPNLRSLHGWLEGHPGCSQGEIVRHAAREWGWRRSTTQDRLRSLMEGGLATQAPRGRQGLYHARPAAGAAPPVA